MNVEVSTTFTASGDNLSIVWRVVVEDKFAFNSPNLGWAFEQAFRQYFVAEQAKKR